MMLWQIEKQYDKKKAQLKEALPFSFTSEQCLNISISPTALPGWNVVIRTKKVKNRMFSCTCLGVCAIVNSMQTLCRSVHYSYYNFPYKKSNTIALSPHEFGYIMCDLVYIEMH